MNFIITPEPPFDFQLTAGFFSYDDEQIRKFDNGKFWQIIRIKDKLVLLEIESLGSVDKPQLSVTLKSDENLTKSDEKIANGIIKSIFNLDLDLTKFYNSIRNDKILSKLAQKLRGLKGPNNSTVFEGVVCSIIEQQISLIVAFNIQKRFTKKFGDILRIGKNKYYAFPTPDKLSNKDLELYRACGLSQRKAEYIKDISRLIVTKELDLEKYKNYLDADKVISELTELRGLGVWSVELTMLRSMQRFDVVPADDLGLKRFVSHHYYNDKKITSQEVREVALNWGTWKGLAAYYFLEADRLGLNVL